MQLTFILGAMASDSNSWGSYSAEALINLGRKGKHAKKLGPNKNGVE